MSEKPLNHKDDMRITYYFTVFFTVAGSILILYLLSFRVEKINVFIIILSIIGGGLPIGFIGAFLDYKVSEYRIKYSKSI